MENIIFRCPVTDPLPKVKKGFNVDLFKALKPPVIQMRVERFDGCEKGDEVHISVGFGIMTKWVSHITGHLDSETEWSFIDEGHVMPFPLTKWRHHHRVIKEGELSIIVDDISFSCGNTLIDKIMKPIIYLQFVGRKSVYQKIFGRP